MIINGKKRKFSGFCFKIWPDDPLECKAQGWKRGWIWSWKLEWQGSQNFYTFMIGPVWFQWYV